MASCILETAPVKVSDKRLLLPCIPATGSTIALNNAALNCGNVSLERSSMPCDALTNSRIPRSLSISAAPAPPAKARPSALAASVALVPINAAKSVTAFNVFCESTPNASNVAPAWTTS